MRLVFMILICMFIAVCNCAHHLRDKLCQFSSGFYWPGGISLFYSVSKRILISILANLVLEETTERIHVGKQYGDIPRGIFIVRGENIVLLGEIVSLGSYFYSSMVN